MPDQLPTPSGTDSTFSNMLNEKLDRLHKQGKATSFDMLRKIKKKKKISKAEISY